MRSPGKKKTLGPFRRFVRPFMVCSIIHAEDGALLSSHLDQIEITGLKFQIELVLPIKYYQ